MGHLEGKTALITGAASGMGRATAMLFAREGADVALLARSATQLQDVAGEVAGLGRRAVPYAADLTDGEAVRRTVAEVYQQLGRLDIVVSVAGTNVRHRSLDALTTSDWDEVLATNLTANLHLTQAALPLMRQQRGGLLIYVSSFCVQRPDASGVAYQASKHGLVGLAHGTMEEERANGIRTTVVFPGLTDTPLLAKRPRPTPSEMLARALQPEDVSAACLFVAALPARAHVPELIIVPAGIGYNPTVAAQ